MNIDSYQVERTTFVNNLGGKTLIPIPATKQSCLVEIIGPIFALPFLQPRKEYEACLYAPLPTRDSA